jgi:hypothetical protein
MEATLKIRAGYDIAFNCFQEVPMLLMLSVHPSRQQDLLTQHAIRFSPNAEARDFRDAFGNVCTRLVAPPGLMEIRNEFLIADSGLPDETDVHAEQWATCPMRLSCICWAADTAIRRSCRTRHGQCSAGSPARTSPSPLSNSSTPTVVPLVFGGLTPLASLKFRPLAADDLRCDNQFLDLLADPPNRRARRWSVGGEHPAFIGDRE